MSRMNLRHMEVFRAVMESGTVTGAARRLNVSQPAVTDLLRHTEDGLGFKLFERIRGRLEPTPEARILYAQITQVFDRVDVVNRIATGLRDSRLGSLDIIAVPALGVTLLPSAIGAFLVRHRESRIRFNMLPRQEMMGQVASGAADLGFGFLSPTFPRVTAREIVRADLVCIMPRGHKLAEQAEVSVEDLASWPLIGYTSSQGLSPIINAILVEARQAQPVAVEVGMIINAWSMVAQGAGIAIVDPHSGYQNLFPGVEVRRLRPAVPLALEVLQAEERPLSRLATAFLQHCERFLAPV
jgi:DNA-binding transcriptional LysR family regulator